MSAPLEGLAGIDIYLLDQILRGRIAPGMTLLDAGCGTGRNISWLLKAGYEVFAADQDEAALRKVRAMAEALAPGLPDSNFRVEPVEAMTFPASIADVVISSAVLHFARDDAHFRAMLDGCWRPLKPGGFLFARLASSIGMEARMQRIRGRRCRLPDGSERYLVDEALLMDLTRELGGTLLDPIKTTVVQDQRCMTTWVVRKDH